MLSPETSPDDAKAVAAFLRTLTDAELSQAIATPQALVDRLEGFTYLHLRTAAEVAVAQLARDEQSRRRDEDVGRRSRQAKRVAIWALVVAILALIVSALA
jgi:hypothetical protein